MLLDLEGREDFKVVEAWRLAPCEPESRVAEAADVAALEVTCRPSGSAIQTSCSSSLTAKAVSFTVSRWRTVTKRASRLSLPTHREDNAIPPFPQTSGHRPR
jgi:hypothetical protein